MSKNKLIFFLIPLFVLIFSLCRKDRPTPIKCLIIVGAKIFNGIDDALIDGKNVIVTNETITSIVTKSQITLEDQSCMRIQAKGKYLIPGLIDSHTHLLAYDRTSVRSWKEALEDSSRESKTSRLSHGLENADSMLSYGFTSVRDLGNSGFFFDEELSFNLQSQQRPTIDFFFSGPGLAISPSQIDLDRHSKEYTLVDDSTLIKDVIALYKGHHISWLKIYADNSRGTKNLISKELLEKIIFFAHQNGLKVALHSEYGASFENSLLALADSIEHAYELTEAIPKSLKRTAVVITEVSPRSCEILEAEKSFDGNCKYTTLTFKNRLVRLQKSGFILVFGSDAVLDFTSRLKSRGEAALDSLLSWERTGFSAAFILKAATSNAANMLEKKIGRISTGYQADFILLNSNPLENLKALSDPFAIVKKGQIHCFQPEKRCHAK